jgi:hypothetical protein
MCLRTLAPKASYSPAADAHISQFTPFKPRLALLHREIRLVKEPKLLGCV